MGSFARKTNRGLEPKRNEVTSSMSLLDMQTDNTLEIYQVIKENFDRKKVTSESYMGKHRFSSSLS